MDVVFLVLVNTSAPHFVRQVVSLTDDDITDEAAWAEAKKLDKINHLRRAEEQKRLHEQNVAIHDKLSHVKVIAM